MSATTKNAKQYAEISKEEFEAVLNESQLDFKLQDYEWAREYIYEADLSGGAFIVRVYSSVDERNDNGRGRGSDAIRISILRPRDERPPAPVGKKTRTNRIQTWRKNLSRKLKEVAGELPSHLKECDKCGSLMTIRERKDDGKEFYGCMSYPDCRNTESI